MTVAEFTVTGLSEDQQKRIEELAVSLRPGQAVWISGYFAGLEQGLRGRVGEQAGAAGISVPQAELAGAPATRLLTILYGSETGNSGTLAKELAETARANGLAATAVDMADYKTRKLKDEQDLLVVTATHGEGDPPRSALGFFEFVEGRKAPRLPNLRYAVLALGDSTYEHYCGAGKRIDHRLAELGASALHPRVDCDVDYETPAATWSAAILALLSPKTGATVGQSVPASAAATTEASPRFDKRHPFPATIIDNITLTGRGSSKETRHIELSVSESGLTFEPGDALGIMPRNDPQVVAAVLDALALSPDAPVTIRDEETSLGEALAAKLEITAATPRFIEHWAAISEAQELRDLTAPENGEARSAFLRGHHIIDIVRRFAVEGVDAATLAAGLRPLQPRLYSIASSLAAAPDEVHLTVSTVRYALNEIARLGVASGQIAERLPPDETIPVYVQANPHFRLPADDAPILMIGAGTGVAPYRAFLQEREARGATGKSWLVFGERNFHSDFLYQTEWQDFLKDGVLTRMHVAFSRDQATKTYVQHRLRERAHDVYGWLEEGAHIYVCGDASHLAPDVHAALLDIVQQEGGLGSDAAHEYLAGLQRDHRYQTDVY